MQQLGFNLDLSSTIALRLDVVAKVTGEAGEHITCVESKLVMVGLKFYTMLFGLFLRQPDGSAVAFVQPLLAFDMCVLLARLRGRALEEEG
eukprot:7581772-Alexandrium_andersonii.AAC.1